MVGVDATDLVVEPGRHLRQRAPLSLKARRLGLRGGHACPRAGLGRREAGESSRVFEGLRPDALHWLVEDGSERLERPFTVDGGVQVFW